MDTVGRRLDEAIRLSGMTINEVNRRAGLSVGEVSRITRGLRKRENIEHFERLAEVLGIRIEWLRRGEGPMYLDGRDVPFDASETPPARERGRPHRANQPRAPWAEQAPIVQDYPSRKVVVESLRGVYPDEVLRAIELLTVVGSDPGESHWKAEAMRLDLERLRIAHERELARQRIAQQDVLIHQSPYVSAPERASTTNHNRPDTAPTHTPAQGIILEPSSRDIGGADKHYERDLQDLLYVKHALLGDFQAVLEAVDVAKSKYPLPAPAWSKLLQLMTFEKPQNPTPETMYQLALAWYMATTNDEKRQAHLEETTRILNQEQAMVDALRAQGFSPESDPVQWNRALANARRKLQGLPPLPPPTQPLSPDEADAQKVFSTSRRKTAKKTKAKLSADIV